MACTLSPLPSLLMVLHALATAGKVAEREENYRLEKAEGRSGRGREGQARRKMRKF